MKQKVANNPKAEKQLAEHRERGVQIEKNKIILRVARVAVGASVTWKRKVTQRTSTGNSSERNDHATEEAQ